MTVTLQKAYAYITHRQRLLVFRHTDYPEAGIQVPAETPRLAGQQDALLDALRETFAPPL